MLVVDPMPPCCLQPQFSTDLASVYKVQKRDWLLRAGVQLPLPRPLSLAVTAALSGDRAPAPRSAHSGFNWFQFSSTGLLASWQSPLSPPTPQLQSPLRIAAIGRQPTDELTVGSISISFNSPQLIIKIHFNFSNCIGQDGAGRPSGPLGLGRLPPHNLNFSNWIWAGRSWHTKRPFGPGPPPPPQLQLQ
jgi:hypothetical protein